LGKTREHGRHYLVIEAAEAFNAYYIAKFINEIAAAGKAVYPLPMYINVWTKENYFGDLENTLRVGQLPI
jgi:hypothetical protein